MRYIKLKSKLFVFIFFALFMFEAHALPPEFYWLSQRVQQHARDIANANNEPSYSQAVLISGSGQADTQTLVIDEVVDFLQREPDKPIKNLLVDRVIVQLEENGITVNNAGLLFSQRFNGGSGRCNSKKHSWWADVDILVKNETSLALLYDALSEPIYLSLDLDAEIGLDGKATLRPGKRVLGHCVKYDRISIGIEMPSIPLELLAEVSINLNPYIIPPEESVSGQYEIILLPKGMLIATIKKLDNIDVNLDIDAYGGIGLIVGTIIGFPVTGFLTEIGLGSNASEELIGKEIEKKALDVLNDFSNEPYKKDITYKLGGAKRYVLPGLTDINTTSLNRVFENVNLPFMPSPDTLSNKDKFLAESLMYSRFDDREVYRLQQNHSNGVLSVLISSALILN